MIVVDEQGTTMQANLLHRWFPKFESILNESDCYYIVKPTIGLNESKYKYVENQSKLGIYCDTEVYQCNQFSGPTYGFSFTNFKGIVEQTIPENQPLDVIGFVADVGKLKNIKTQRGNDTKKLNVVLQDLQMQKINLSLWGSYADMILEHWEKREQVGLIVVILQFASLKYFGNCAFVNNCFSVSKLFINCDIDEITLFRNSLLEKSAASSCSTQSSKLSGMFLSLYDEYVVRSEFNNIAELNLHQVKSVVIVGTVRLIPKDFPWYYLACKTCNRKVTKQTDHKAHTVGVLVDEEEVYKCKTQACNNGVVQFLQRFRVPLTVQDSTGTVYLTLFDRDACKLLNSTASAFIDKYGIDNVDSPTEFDVLLGKKFAFKIDISQYNLDNGSSVFSITKLTDDVDVIAELEKKANNVEVDNSTSVGNEFNDIQSQGTVELKDVQSEDLTVGIRAVDSTQSGNSKAVAEYMAENGTPLAETLNDKCIEKNHVTQAGKLKRKSKHPDFKKNLVESFDLEDVGQLSTTKPRFDGKPTLLIPKIEK